MNPRISHPHVDFCQDLIDQCHEDSSESGDGEKPIVRRRTLGTVPLFVSMVDGNRSRASQGVVRSVEKRRMTVPTQMLGEEPTQEQRENELKNILVFLIKGSRWEG